MSIYYRNEEKSSGLLRAVPQTGTYWEGANVPSDVQKLFDVYNSKAPWNKNFPSPQPKMTNFRKVEEKREDSEGSSSQQRYEQNHKIHYSKFNITNNRTYKHQTDTGSMTDLSDFSLGCYSDEDEQETKEREMRNKMKLELRQIRQSQFFAKHNLLNNGYGDNNFGQK
ncbi:unnamed protein product [Caenorhabditis angaria]|uniref:Uncharacterized protein n=1 Tax=Caenorhabditis angaria TaxID=860376 RepID=A0A9P1IQQ0_9PELO|nr:unnamed protein product [Caenorhabditis angaria]